MNFNFATCSLAIGCLFFCPALQAENGLQLIDGSQIKATIDSISPAGIVRGDGVGDDVSLETIIAYQSQSTPVAPGSVELSIAAKGRLFTSKITIGQSTATVSTGDGTTYDVPLDLIEAVIFKRTELVAKTLTDRSDNQDTVIVNTPAGEKVVAGIFEGIDGGKIGLNFNGKSRKIGIEKVNAIVLADLRLNSLEGAKVELRDRTRLNGKLQEVSDGQLILAVTPTSNIKVPWASVLRMEIKSDNLVFLSDLDPIETDQKSIFAPQRNWQRDRSVESNPLQLQFPDQRSPRIFRKGIGTQSYCELKFANTNEFQRFRAVAGIDTETDGRGDCQMLVLADGIQLWSQRITAQTPPVEIDVDITGMKTVTLVVEPGQQFDLADHANWADAKFVKP